MNLNIMNEFGADTIKDWPLEQQVKVMRFIYSNDINVDHGWIYAGDRLFPVHCEQQRVKLL